jgi:hypothetical protein
MRKYQSMQQLLPTKNDSTVIAGGLECGVPSMLF